MGSEFAFEDLSSQEVEKYTYKFLRDDDCGDLKCFVIERDPVDKYSGYTRQEVWIDTQEYRVQLAKVLSEKAEDARKIIRKAREDAWEEVQEKTKKGELPFV